MEWSDPERRRLIRFQDRARSLGGPKADRKLQTLLEVLKAQLKEGHHPIVFCRFIPTANYLGSWLAAELKSVHVTAVTGEIDDEQRRERVAELSRSAHRILVATDCLSEGVNLQGHFDSVVDSAKLKILAESCLGVQKDPGTCFSAGFVHGGQALKASGQSR